MTDSRLGDARAQLEAAFWDFKKAPGPITISALVESLVLYRMAWLENATR